MFVSHALHLVREEDARLFLATQPTGEELQGRTLAELRLIGKLLAIENVVYLSKEECVTRTVSRLLEGEVYGAAVAMPVSGLGQAPDSRPVSPGGISQEEYSHVSPRASPAKMLNTALGFEGQAFSIAEGSSCFQPVVSTAGQMPRYVSPVPFMMPQQFSNIQHSVTSTSFCSVHPSCIEFVFRRSVAT